MTFVERFVHFSISLADTDRAVNATIRLKVPKHPLESPEFFWTRIIAFCHKFHSDLAFSSDLFDDRAPTIGVPSIHGGYETWIDVGVPDKEKLRKALRDPQCNTIAVYFTSSHEIDLFSKQLKGSTENWIERVIFYRIDPVFLAPFLENTNTRHIWSITIVDERMYLEYDGNTIEGEIAPIDMWDAFQKHISGTNS